MNDFSPRAMAVFLRTYCRTTKNGLESPNQAIERAHRKHHRRLADEVNKPLAKTELEELTQLALERKSWVAGRTLWLGGTDYAFSRPCCQFNCASTQAATVFDLVDIAWLLLNGSGVGFKPIVGILHGFANPLTVDILASRRGPSEKGRETNTENFDGKSWQIGIGDSASSWAKALGKLFQPPGSAQKFVLDATEIRGPGQRLSGYGWICNGSEPLLAAMKAIAEICNCKAGNLLDEIDILDVVNHVGTVLSSRRSAQIALLDANNCKATEFSWAKERYWEGNNQRRQSNNTLLFWSKPSKVRLEELLRQADECGGDPGICNAEAARNKAPWFEGMNPCSEILLPRFGFCNLVSNCLPRFRKNFAALERAVYAIARANYRQTCVNLDDGVLQPQWHQTNASLRLCGVSLTGIVQADWLTDYQIRRLRDTAVRGACSQADEWGFPRPKAVTTIKPEGTASKGMGSLSLGEVSEGIHKPLGKYIFNWINFSIHDPLVPSLEAAGYKVLPSPADINNVLICFPVEYRNIRWDRVDGKEVNLESALAQLNRYYRWVTLWADHNVSCTVSYSPDEIPSIVDWLDRNWDRGFISVSFLRRADPSKTAADLGHPYLPQEVVTVETFRRYSSTLRSVDWSKISGHFDVDVEECRGGVCPIK